MLPTPQFDPDLDIGKTLDKSPIYREYVQFLVSPPDARLENWGYDSDLQFSEHHEIARKTLYEWRKRPDFVQDVEIAAKYYLAANAQMFVAGILGQGGIKDSRKLALYKDFVFGATGVQVVLNIENMEVNELSFHSHRLAQALKDE